MRLSLVFELLLIFVLLAFAASRVIDSEGLRNNHRSLMQKSRKVSHKNRQDVNKYCNCSTKLCNCCREFNIPVVSLQGPGCATLQYLQGDRLAISMSFGERVLSNTTLSGKKPKPVCMQLPGGVSKFCGRVYDIAREGEDFKACLGLELRALEDIEASLRVSCFRFGPKGLKVEPSQPLPVITEAGNKDEDADDDDDDDDDDEYDFDDEYDLGNDVDTVDYTGFGVFDDDFVGNLFGVETESEKIKVKKPKPVKKVSISTTKAPLRVHTNKPTKPARKPVRKVTTVKPVIKFTTPVIKIISTSEPIQLEKQPEFIQVNLTSPNNASSEPSQEKLPSTSHESIAAVTAMLQEIPMELEKLGPVTVAPLDKSTETVADVAATAVPDTTTSIYKITDVTEAVTEDEEEETSTEIVENLILRRDDEDAEDDDDDEDDPISSAVEDVLDDDEDANLKKNKTQDVVKEKIEKNNVSQKQSEDVVDEIVDGMMETITGEDEPQPNTKKNVKHSKGYHDDDDDDDDDDEDDDENDGDDDYDDDEDDDDEARKMRSKQKRRKTHPS